MNPYGNYSLGIVSIGAQITLLGVGIARAGDLAAPGSVMAEAVPDSRLCALPLAVPNLPTDFMVSAEMEQLHELLLAESATKETVGFVGTGGIGKSFISGIRISVCILLLVGPLKSLHFSVALPIRPRPPPLQALGLAAAGAAAERG